MRARRWYPNKGERDMISVLPRQVKANAMDIPLDHSTEIPVYQHLTSPSRKRMEEADALVLYYLEDRDIPWERLPGGDALRTRWRRCRREGRPETWSTALPGPRGGRLFLSRQAGDANAFARQDRGRRLAADLMAEAPRRLLIAAARPDPALDAAAQALLQAVLLRACPMPTLKTRSEPVPRPGRIDCHDLTRPCDLTRLRMEVRGNHLARWLTRLPANELAPASYRRRIEALARAEGWKTDFLGLDRLRRQQAGAFLAVAQGSPEDSGAGILHLRYRPPGRRRSRPPVALVGKGICFDTGGVNIKSARYMHGMHEDMEGSAVALGTLLALSRLEVDFAVDCYLALAENAIGPRAYKPNDVVRAANGTSIEIIHTDAEGRMVLADTLWLAARKGPGLIIDYATLTGACIQALSTRYSGVFTNRPAWIPALIEAGRTSGERIWPFPLDPDFDQPLESEVADVKQCTLDAEADHILAARFLQRFVPAETPWIHLDLAAGNHKGGLGAVPTDITGFGVRLSLHLLLDQALPSPDEAPCS